MKCLLISPEGLEMALKNPRHVIVNLQQLVLQRLDAVCLLGARCRGLQPGCAIQVVLAAEVSDQLRDLDQRHGARRVFRPDDLRNLCARR